MALVLPQMVEVTLHGKNIKYFEDKGYEIPRRKDREYRYTTPKGTKIMVNVLDLSNKSNKEVIVKCDYCGKEILKTINNFIRHKEIINKDCCNECSPIKLSEIIQAKYGVSNVNKLQWVKDSKINTFIINYGVDNPMKDKVVQDKAKYTNNILYGGNSPSHCKEVLEKISETLYKNGTQKCSTQQKYLHNLLQGELNYPVERCNLDIGFPKEMIYIEYDGSGHDLSVKFGSETFEQFNNKNKKRDYFLFSKGWKEIRIISLNDKLPLDDKIQDMIIYAKKYINTGHSWIKFDIDNNVIINRLGVFYYDFGELRKIKSNLKGGKNK